MKTIVCIIMALFCVTCLAVPAFAAHYDHVKIMKDNNVDGAAFLAGSPMNFSYFYLVDRTAGVCFAALVPGGLQKIDCEPLKKVEAIKTYIETGKLP